MSDDRQDNSEERLRAVTVGRLAPHDAPIVLDMYDEAWPSWFHEESGELRSILGDKVVMLEHVGSTSVPGLSAKPVIDMLLVVGDSADEQAYVAPLEAHGYVLRIREPDWHEHRLLKGPRRNINLHVFSRGCTEVRRMLLFRDWLRRNPDERERYESAKRALAQRHWKYVQNYADAKSEIVEAILARASARTRPESP
ncbi:MAG: GrpB family protein [Candidatus Eremiobacteraeota bacterium]|nr:GrpB family protein [Candidatus Eremiobacteraeota bacterium]MBV8280821.1 GrpB family protein [Candidatus Eremiobacteraeota bacterium]MBV8366033.1 GrpB family protein [Candidatus Eremiobacteraeota bacterium]